MKKLLVFIFIIKTALIITHDLPQFKPGEEPETVLNFMKRVYPSGKSRQGSEFTGTPLLLTPFIEENNLEEARIAAKVDSEHFLPHIQSYAGYLTVNKEYNSNLWFWYFPVPDRPVEDTPWIIWLQGGPGATSLFGLFTEIGPYFVTKDVKLEEMKYSWGKNHSLLFIDNPVGTGFSFTEDDRGYATNQTKIGEELYIALQQFLTIFPELRKAPLTIAGESYAGKHIPSLGIQILWHRNEDPAINLQGLAIGNGWMDPLSLHHYSDFVREVGLVDDGVADIMSNIEKAVVQFINNGDLLNANTYHNYMFSIFTEASKLGNLYNYLVDDIPLRGEYVDFILRDEVRRALHTGGTYTVINDLVSRKLTADIMSSAKPWIQELINNYQVMCYSGHLDIIVAYHPSVHTYNTFIHSGSVEYARAERLPWYHNNELAGYYKIGGNFTDVMVRGSGHMVPTDKPSVALGLISAFARGLPLSTDTGYLVGEEYNLK